MILIISAINDLHALSVQAQVRQKSNVPCHIIETDRIAQNVFMSYSVGFDGYDSLRTSEGLQIAVEEADLIWLRRPRSSQIMKYPIADSNIETLIENDCRGGFSGYLESRFSGKWISTHEATYKAANKMYQLKIADKCGFRIPKTLVSQNFDDIVNFSASCSEGIIAKTIVGASEIFLRTIKLDKIDELDEESVMAAPTIYQEYIPGEIHLRWNCFGNQSYPARIKTAELDWRPNLNIPISAYEPSPKLHKMVRKTLDALDLEMGIVDLKITPSGEPVWLEVNPQGQFIFLDPIANMNLIDNFTDYILSEVPKSQHLNKPISLTV